MATEPEIDPIHGTPMSKGMRRVLWAFFAVVSIGGMALVSWQWRQQRKAVEARTPKIDRSSKARNAIDPAKPPKKATFAKPQPSKAAGQGPGSRG